MHNVCILMIRTSAKAYGGRSQSGGVCSPTSCFSTHIERTERSALCNEDGPYSLFKAAVALSILTNLDRLHILIRLEVLPIRHHTCVTFTTPDILDWQLSHRNEEGES